MTKHEMLTEAIIIATASHKDQVDKAGMPYILHCLHVMNNVDTIPEKIVAVLHDTIEDTETTLEMLLNLGFSIEILKAIDAITKKEGESYNSYLERVKENKLARNVKKADLKHNVDLTRLPKISKKDKDRAIKYQQAYLKLQ